MQNAHKAAPVVLYQMEFSNHRQNKINEEKTTNKIKQTKYRNKSNEWFKCESRNDRAGNRHRQHK